MLKYTARRLLHTIPVVLLISVVVFVINQLLPGDLAQAILGDTGHSQIGDSFRIMHSPL